jgi:STAS domain
LAEPAPSPAAPSNAPHLERREGVVVLRGAIERGAVAALCERARPLLGEIAAADTGAVVCEVGSLRSDLAAVDTVARLALIACRLDRGIRLRDATPALRELLSLAGLAEVVRSGPEAPDSGLDPGR